ncbi:MAG: hypothetical protein L0Y57_05260 [Beijerinckiaceae bacterium]|nr:hypothetical protein [Beijerinckiaceae bacterium]
MPAHELLPGRTIWQRCGQKRLPVAARRLLSKRLNRAGKEGFPVTMGHEDLESAAAAVIVLSNIVILAQD